MIMPRDELGKHDRKRRVTKDKVDERVAAGPEEKDRGDTRDVLFENGGFFMPINYKLWHKISEIG